MRRFIDGLRELLLPTLGLTILATLWVVAQARNGDADLHRRYPPVSQEVWDQIERASREDDTPDSAATPTAAAAAADATAKVEVVPVDHH